MTLRKLRRFLLIFLILVTGVLALLFATLNLPFTERFATRKVNQILAASKVPIHIHAIRRILPNSVAVQGVLIEDLKGDTIIYADKLNADIRLLALLRKKVILEYVDLSQASMKLLRNQLSLNINIAETFTAGRVAKARKKDKAKANWIVSIMDGTLSSVHFQMSDSISGIHILQDIEEIGIKNFSLPLEDREIRAHTLKLGKSTGYVHLANHASQEPEPKKNVRPPWNFALLNLDLEDIDFVFDQNQGDLSLHLVLGEGEIRAREMELHGRVADIKSVSLKRAKATVLTSQQKKVPKSPSSDQGKSPWFLQGKDIDLEDVDVSIGNHEELDILGLEMKLKGFILDKDHAAMRLQKLSFDLGNGFSMKKMSGELDSDRESCRLDLALETDQSQVNLEGSANQSITEIISKPEEMQKANLSINKTSISLKDLFPFVQEWKENMNITALAKQSYSVSGDLELVNSILGVSGFSLSQDQNFQLTLEGRIEKPFPFAKARGDLKLGISEVDISWLEKMLSGMGIDRAMPNLSRLTVESHVKNSFSSPDFDLKLRSNLGSIYSSGSLNFSTDSFSMQASFDDLWLGKVLNIPDLGSFSGSSSISGQGFSRDNYHSRVSLLVDSLGFKDYNYTGIRMEGSLEHGEYAFHMIANDTFFTGDIKALLIPTDTVLQVAASGTLRAQLNELNLTEDTLSLNTQLAADFIYREDFLELELSGSNIVLINPYQSDEIKQIKASFITDSVNTTIKATGDFFTLDLQVAMPFSELDSLGVGYRDYMATFTDPQHKNTSTRVMSLPEINATGKITDHEFFDIILKDTGFHISNLDLSMQHHALENRINYGIRGHGISYEKLELDTLTVAVIDSAGMMNVSALADDFSMFSGPENDLSLIGTYGNWHGTTSLSVVDPQGQKVYDIDVAARMDSSKLILEVPSKSLILNHQPWILESSDLLTLNVSPLTLSPRLSMYTDSSFLHLFESTEEGILTYKLDMKQVELESLVRDDLFPGRPDAVISGSVGLSMLGETERKIASDLHFTHVDYSDLSFNKISLKGHMVYGDSGKYDLDVFARLDSAEINLKGLKTEEGERQFQSKLSDIPMNLLQPFTKEFLSDLRGFISGEFDVSNINGSDRVDGQLSFQGVQLRINALNSTFRVPDQGLYVSDEKLLFNKFRILDTLNNEMLVDGFLDFENVDQVNTDMNISSSKLQVMSRGNVEDDTPFYGDVFVDSEFSVKGPLLDPSIRGNILLSRGTEVFYRHMDDLSMSESQKILSFESSTSPDDPSQAPVIRRQSTLIRSSLETIVEIDPSTLINVNLSKKIYDLEMKIKGGGSLNYNMVNNSQMSLSGSYEIGEGAAELKLVGWPNKIFRIEEGGYIRWDGRVEDPELSFRALNRVSSSYQNPMDGKQRPVDFDVGLQLTDRLSDMDVLFTVNTSDQYLMSIINTLSPEEQMRQAISILLFEVIDLPGISSSSNYMSQQVNSILASQLNQFTQSAIKGVDISFGLDTYTTTQTGGEETNTSLSYEVRKSLLNDRAHIEVSGRIRDMNQSPGTTNNALNNISLEYSLDSAATKFLKVYNEHSYEDVFEGEVIKTGIGFSVRKRHRHLRDIWKRKKKDKKGRKEERREE